MRIKEEARHTRVNIIAAPILSFAYIEPLIHSHIFSSSFSLAFFSFLLLYLLFQRFLQIKHLMSVDSFDSFEREGGDLFGITWWQLHI